MRKVSKAGVQNSGKIYRNSFKGARARAKLGRLFAYAEKVGRLVWLAWHVGGTVASKGQVQLKD